MRKLSFTGILLSCLLILGCGSGGGGNNHGLNTESSGNNTSTNPSPDTESTNAKPVAVIKGNTNAKPGQLVELSGSDSSDADGDLLIYKWSLIYFPTGSRVTLSDTNVPYISLIPDFDGLYKVQLIVNDGVEDSNPTVKEITASAQEWNQVGKALNIFDHGMAGEPSLAIYKGILYASWGESEKTLVDEFSNPYLPAQLFVKYLDGIEWIQTGSSLNTNPQNGAIYSRLATGTDSLFLAFTEITKQDDPRIFNLYVKKWDGKTWTQLGGPLNIDPESMVYSSPSITVIGNTPYVAWNEYNPKMDNQGHTLDVKKVYVKYWNGTDWSLLGGALNIDITREAFNPVLATDGTSIYVGFLQTELLLDEMAYEYKLGRSSYVKKWNGDKWEQVGERILRSWGFSLGLVATSSSLYLWSGTSNEFYQWNGIKWDLRYRPDTIFNIAFINDSRYVLSGSKILWSHSEDHDMWIQITKPGNYDNTASPYTSLITNGESIFLCHRTCDPLGCRAVVDEISINGE